MRQGIVPEIGRVIPFVQEAGQFPNLCTIQSIPGTKNAMGAPIITFSDVAGLVNIPCHAAPPSIFRLSGSNELRKPDRTDESQEFHVLLSGYFPQIQMNMRAVVDGVPYNIVGIDQDAFHTQTRLEVQAYTLG